MSENYDWLEDNIKFVESEMSRLTKERDEARAEVERLRTLVPKLCAKWKERVTEAHAEVERLKAENAELRKQYDHHFYQAQKALGLAGSNCPEIPDS